MLKMIPRDFCLARAAEHEERAAACSDAAARELWLETAAEWRRLHGERSAIPRRRGGRR